MAIPIEQLDDQVLAGLSPMMVSRCKAVYAFILGYAVGTRTPPVSYTIELATGLSAQLCNLAIRELSQRRLVRRVGYQLRWVSPVLREPPFVLYPAADDQRHKYLMRPRRKTKKR